MAETNLQATTLFLQLSVLLGIAVFSHFFVKRFRQSTILGEIAIGVVMGPTVVGFILAGWRPPADGSPGFFDPSLVSTLSLLGAIFLLFILGLESDIRALFQRRNIVIAIGGIVLPWVAGFGLAYLMVPAAEIPTGEGGRFVTAVFIGATLVATSTAIAAAVMVELGRARSEVAATIMGAAVVDDILGLMVFSMAQGVATTGGVDVMGLAQVVVSAVLFVALGTFIGLRFFSRLVVSVQIRGLRLGLTRGGFMAAMAVAFLYAFVAEALHLSAIVGAFIAGAMLAGTPLKRELEEGTGYLSTLFTPIFFIGLGLLVNLWALAASPRWFDLLVFAAVLTPAAVLTKLAGCGIPARLAGMTKVQSLVVGTGMVPRGEVGLIIAVAAFNAGVIGNSLYSVIVLVMVLVSVLPVPFLRRYVRELEDTAPS